MTGKLNAKGRMKQPFSNDDLLHSGSTMLNLALTGNPDGGFLKGRYFYFVGDSSSGKTFFTLASLAEASINPEFDGYRLIYDDVEGGALMDVERYFGAKLADRIEPPAGTKERPIYSSLIEEFYFHLDDAFNKKEPFIYVLDSQDALDSMQAVKKFKKIKAAAATNTKAKGEMIDGKAKFHSGRIRGVCSKLRNTESMLIVVNQTRDILNAAPFGPKTQASGGRALRFYAAAQIWTSVQGRFYRTIHKNKRQIGIEVKIAVKKNRITGKEWTVVVPIYWSTGVDDVGSCVDFIAEEGFWKKNDKTGVIIAEDFEGVFGTLDKIVETIEDSKLEGEVRDIAIDLFREVEKASLVKRKSRYE